MFPKECVAVTSSSGQGTEPCWKVAFPHLCPDYLGLFSWETQSSVVATLSQLASHLFSHLPLLELSVPHWALTPLVSEALPRELGGLGWASDASETLLIPSHPLRSRAPFTQMLLPRSFRELSAALPPWGQGLGTCTDLTGLAVDASSGANHPPGASLTGYLARASGAGAALHHLQL